MLYAILAAALVALDQVVKYLVRANIQAGQVIEVIPGLMGLTYVENTGAAFSMFSEHTWLLTLVSAVVSAVLAAALFKNVVRHPFGKLTLAVILAGAVGNLIDRAVMGYVTDMFKTLFMDFAVFNVADCFITVGAVLLGVYLLFIHHFPDEKKKDENGTPETDA